MPIQKLELVDRRFDALVEGEKTSTVRLDEGRIEKGFMLYYSSSRTRHAVVMVTDVDDVPLGKVGNIVGFDDHTPDNETMLAQMQRHYPDITLDTKVMLVQHLSVAETKERYGDEVAEILEQL